MPETLLVELLCEELPPKALQRLSEAFATGVEGGLRKRGLLTAVSEMTAYATPRRLAVSISAVAAVAADSEEFEKLMPVKVALDAAGGFSMPMRKKLEGLGRAHMTSLDARDGPAFFKVESDGRADYVYFRSLAKGQSLSVALQTAIEDTLENLPIPKRMSYQLPDGTTVHFARPAHRLLALHGKEVVDVSALGLDAGRVTAGHRFLGRREITVETAQAWRSQLEAEGKVIASFVERREKIVDELKMAAAGATVIMPDALVDEVTALTEWPKVYTAGFDQAFLTVPQECLILTMQQNQRYFALADANGKLQNRFLLVSNIDPHDPEAIIRGNERVLRARLADAKFFFDQDRKIRLADRVARLASVTYHNKIGAMYERMVRIRGIAIELANKLGIDAVATGRAAELCKADLLTEMVGEFPELQGTMGRYYAQHDGETADVANAIGQHYLPRFAGDALPESGVGQIVAVADKIEALTGLFGVGLAPSGDSDPLGLRRAALGLVRILVEKRVRLGLKDLVRSAVTWHQSDIPGKEWARVMSAQEAAKRTSGQGGASGFAYSTRIIPPEAIERLCEFLYDRLKSYLRELGYSSNQIASVVDAKPDLIDDAPDRLEAVKAFEGLPESQALAAANKRVINILRKSGDDALPALERDRLTDGAERELCEEIELRLQPGIRRHLERGDFAGALMTLASAAPVIDRFFAEVMVMADDPVLRGNRLALLRGLEEVMNQVADISKLAL